MSENKAKKRLFQSYGSLIKGGMRKNFLKFLKPQKNLANTNIFYHSGKLHALCEIGRPFIINPLTLETIREETFSNKLGKYAAFCAHPKTCPKTGDMYTIGSKTLIAYFKLIIFKIDKNGELQEILSLPMDKRRAMTHDFLLVDNHIILTYHSFYAKHLFSLLAGFKSGADSVYFDPKGNNTVFLIDLNTKTYKTFNMNAQFITHYINGYKSGNDFVYYNFPSNNSPLEALGELMHNKESEKSIAFNLQKVTIKNNGVQHKIVKQLNAEMPTINKSYEGKENNYFYANYSENLMSSIIIKSDFSGKYLSYDYGINHYAGEPLFVENKNEKGEDSGWVMTIVYNENNHKSFLSIIDAKSFKNEISRIHLPFHIPLGFHSNFVKGNNISGFDDHHRF